MAKSKSFFGLRQGSTKSLTFQVNAGKQITKDRVSIVKNPRSQAQMEQRMLMATASAAYAAMKQIVDHSFEGITYGQQTMSEFIRLNIKLIREDYSAGAGKFGYNPYQNRNLLAGDYIMSQGKASDINTSIITVSAGASNQTIVLGASGTGSDAPTASQLAAALGIAIGEMCTVCLLTDDLDANGNPDDKFTFVRIKYDAAGDVALTTANIASYFTIESPHAVTVATASTGVTLTVAMASGGNSIAFVAIHSVLADGVWKRNNTKFELPGTWDIQPSAEEALATYPIGASYVLNGGNF